MIYCIKARDGAQVNISKNSPYYGSSSEVCCCEVGFSEIGSAEVGISEACCCEVGFTEVGSALQPHLLREIRP